MTIDEAITHIRTQKDFWAYIDNGEESNVVKSLDMALSALYAQQNAEKNEPLTRNDLRNMDGQPVWIEFIPDADSNQLKMWALVSVNQKTGEMYLLNYIGGSSSFDEVWADIRAIYRRPPKGKEL